MQVCRCAHCTPQRSVPDDPRNAHTGQNSTNLDASFGDPAAIVVAGNADTRITEVVGA